MKLYRFELAFMGEMQNVGFLHGLNDIGLDAETERQMLAHSINSHANSSETVQMFPSGLRWMGFIDIYLPFRCWRRK